MRTKFYKGIFVIALAAYLEVNVEGSDQVHNEKDIIEGRRFWLHCFILFLKVIILIAVNCNPFAAICMLTLLI